MPNPIDREKNFLARLAIGLAGYLERDPFRQVVQEANPFLSELIQVTRSDQKTSRIVHNSIKKIPQIIQFVVPFAGDVDRQETETVIEADPNKSNLLYIGGLMLYISELQKLTVLAQSFEKKGVKGIGEKIEKYSSLNQEYIAGLFLMRLGNISLSDIARGTINISSSDALYFLVTAWELLDIAFDGLSSPLLDRVIKENLIVHNGKEFPFSTREDVASAARNVVILTKTELTSLDDSLIKGGVEKEAAQEVLKLIHGIHMLRSDIKNTVLKPSFGKQEYEDLIKEMDTMISNDALWQRTLRMAYLLDPKTIKESYRKALVFASGSRNPQFYAKLAARLREYVENAEVSGLPLSIHQFEDDFDVGSIPQLPTQGTSFGEVQTIAQSITHQNKSLLYNLEASPLPIQWGSLEAPTMIEVQFDQYNPVTKFTMRLIWGKDEDEMQEIWISVDTKKEKMDWIFLESPDEPDLDGQKNYFLGLMKTVLAEIQKQTKTIPRQIPTESLRKPALVKKPKVHIRDEKLIEARTQIKRDRNAGRLSTLVVADLPVTRKEFRGSITTGETGLKRMLNQRNIPAAFHNAVIASVATFNKGGGRLRPIEDAPGLFRIRTAGHYRIILKKRDDNDFDILDIVHREETTYKKVRSLL